VNVITGVIKSNLPTRIAFQVSSQVDARTILDRKGAEVLLGRGDMLYAPPGAAHTERLQSPMVLDEDIEQIVEYAASQAEQEFDMSVFETRTLDSSDSHAPDATGDMSEELQEAMEIVVNERRASTSYLQRRLRIGYNRAAELMDQLEEHGIVGPSLGAKPREVLVDEL
jgi:S-DNA-T family DNA segregation ATPase FtsK/SpoIIIE